MVTAKIGGSSSPCTKRQKMTWFSVGASAVMVAGISNSAIATTIRRFRPITSDSAPANGAVAATAKVPAVIIRLASAAPTPYSRAIIGSTACGAYRCRNAPMAQKATAMRRGSANMADHRPGGFTLLGLGGGGENMIRFSAVALWIALAIVPATL